MGPVLLVMRQTCWTGSRIPMCWGETQQNIEESVIHEKDLITGLKSQDRGHPENVLSKPISKFAPH